MLPPRPQGNGYADADGDGENECDGEANEKTAHGLSALFGMRSRSPNSFSES
jgi:hypothetical protein